MARASSTAVPCSCMSCWNDAEANPSTPMTMITTAVAVTPIDATAMRTAMLLIAA